MNPFLFSYSLKVDQTEIQDTGFLNFLKLLGSPVSDLIDSASAASKSMALSANEGGNLALLIERTNDPPTEPHSTCADEQRKSASEALKELALVRTKVITEKAKTLEEVSDAAELYKPGRESFLAQKDKIFDSSIKSDNLCSAANTLQ